MKNKNIIPNLSFLMMMLVVLTATTGKAQTASDFVFVESTVSDYEQLHQQYAANSSVYFNQIGKPALYVYNQMMPARLVQDLFIYVPTSPGVLKFGSGNVTPNTIDDYADDLATLAEKVQGSIIIHSNDVFSGASGASFKAKLEALTGLPVIMDANQQPFSN